MSFSVLASFAALQLGGGNQIASMIFMYGAIFAIFYFVLIRPQQRQQPTRLLLKKLPPKKLRPRRNKK